MLSKTRPKKNIVHSNNSLNSPSILFSPQAASPLLSNTARSLSQGVSGSVGLESVFSSNRAEKLDLLWFKSDLLKIWTIKDLPPKIQAFIASQGRIVDFDI